MIGMFQSSRIASGNPRLQTTSSFSPSSASTIWKSRPSRIRLATFRMTLESSTTRHVFILTPTLRYSEETFPVHALYAFLPLIKPPADPAQFQGRDRHRARPSTDRRGDARRRPAWPCADRD